MIFKTQHVRASTYTPQKASTFVNNHLKYLQYRGRNPERENKTDRLFFNAAQDRLNWRPVAKEIMQERAGDIYCHRMIFSPADDEPVTDWQAWTRAIMSDLEKRLGKSLNWYATHHQNTVHPHMHIILQGTGIDHRTGRAASVTLNPHDFTFIRDRGREYSEHEEYHFFAETLRDLSERDTISQELEQHPGSRDPRQSKRGTDADFGR